MKLFALTSRTSHETAVATAGVTSGPKKNQGRRRSYAHIVMAGAVMTVLGTPVTPTAALAAPGDVPVVGADAGAAPIGEPRTCGHCGEDSDASLQEGSSPWSSGTALTLPAGRAEVGVFQPLRYGWHDGVEVSTHPLLDVLMPNAALKKRWIHDATATFSTRHALTYPSGLLSVLAREGVGGILPNDSIVPHIVALNQEALLTVAVGEAPERRRLLLTGKLGVTLAARFGRMRLPSIDLPVVHARTAAYRRGWSVNAGFDTDWLLSPSWSVFADIDLFLLSTKRGRFAVEQSTMAAWHFRKDARFMLGYKAVYGGYAFGREWNLGNSWVPLPMVDLQWAY